MTGLTATGKSSLVNAIVRKDVAREGKDLGGVTRTVNQYSTEMNGVTYNIWDSPGLLQDIYEDDVVITDRIKSTLKKHCPQQLHLLLYCLRMDRDRFEKSEESAITHLTDIFSPEIWETSVFALTFANRVILPPPDRDTGEEAPKWFKERIGQFQERIIDALVSAGMDHARALKVPVIPTSYHTAKKFISNPGELLDRKDWFNPFLHTSLKRILEIRS